MAALYHNKLNNCGGKIVGSAPQRTTPLLLRESLFGDRWEEMDIAENGLLNPNCRMDLLSCASYFGNIIPFSKSGGWWLTQFRSWWPFTVVSPKNPLRFVKLIWFVGNPSSRQAAASSASSSASDLEARKEAGCRFTASTPARRVDELNCLLSDITGKGQGPRKLDTKRKSCSSPRGSSWCPWLKWCVIKAIYVFSACFSQMTNLFFARARQDAHVGWCMTLGMNFLKTTQVSSK